MKDYAHGIHINYANRNPFMSVQSLTLGACARVTVVVLCVCLSVITLAATYLVCKSKLW